MIEVNFHVLVTTTEKKKEYLLFYLLLKSVTCLVKW
jgi:hypothetical protein